MVTEIEVFESGAHCSLGLEEERSLDKKRVYTRRFALSHFGYCCPLKKGEDQLRRTTRDFCILVAECIEVDGGIVENLL
jgi:hypothetical protein